MTAVITADGPRVLQQIRELRIQYDAAAYLVAGGHQPYLRCPVSARRENIGQCGH